MSAPHSMADMFDGVAPWYDAMNRRMSLGMDRHWRRQAARFLPPDGRGRILDLATGTADLALAAVQQGAEWVVGVDLSAGMLKRAQQKVHHRGRQGRIVLLQGDVFHLPFPNASFDALMNAFLLRNLPQLEPAFAEMARVTRPNGILICLEIAYPRFRPWRDLFRFYFDRLVPLLGRWLTRVAPAYRYLPHSLARFPAPQEVLEQIAAAGWREATAHSIFPGTVRVYRARRESQTPPR